jgi:hypothetical protein
MRVQVNVIFDLENEADRAAIVARLGGIFSAAHVETEVVPLAGNGSGISDQTIDANLAPPPAKTPSPGRVQAAANARAAKQAKAVSPPDDRPVGVGGAANGGDQAGPADDADADDDALGLNSPSMSPGEAKDAALALVREAYSAGHVAQVKALQKELGVAKFYDVDVTTGHAFYQRVMKLAHEVGIRR